MRYLTNVMKCDVIFEKMYFDFVKICVKYEKIYF